MKVEVNVLNSIYSDYNFIAFMASKSLKDPPIIILLSHIGLEDNEDGQDELLDSYNKLLMEHIKFEKSRKKALEILEERDQELIMLKAILEEKNSIVNHDKSDLTKKI